MNASLGFKSLSAALLTACILTQSTARAGIIGEGDFGPSAQVSDFDNLGLGFQVPSPHVVDGHTLATGTTFLRYQDFGFTSPASVTGEQFSTDADRETITIELSAPSKKAGLLATGFLSTGWSIAVQFLDGADSVLGTQNLFGLGTAMVFTGWESPAGDIAKITLTDNSTDSRVMAIDNLTVEVVPEPGALLLLISVLWAALPIRRR